MNLLDLVEKIESLEKQINNNYAQIQGIFLREERTKEKIEKLEVEIKKVDKENFLRVGRWRESCIEMIYNKFYELSEKLEDISSFKDRKNEPLTPLKEVIREITDTERLDFLEKNNLFVYPKKYSSLDKWCVYPSGTQGIIPNGNRDTLREAIDSAIRSNNEK